MLDGELLVDELVPTPCFKDIEQIPEARARLQAAWDGAAASYEEQEQGAPLQEKLWRRFCSVASAALTEVLGAKTTGTRPKGSETRTRKRALWARPTLGGAGNVESLLPHRGLVLVRRLRQQLNREGGEAALQGLGGALRRVATELGLQGEGEHFPSTDEELDAIQAKLEQTAAATARATRRRRRLEDWRDRMGGTLRAACRWLRGGPPPLNALDGPGGERLTRPQEVAREVHRRCSEQFATQQPQEEAQHADLFDSYGHLLRRHDCELRAMTPERLRHFVTKKRRGSAGSDGWTAPELDPLPDDAWQLLVETCEVAEKTGTWPKAWTLGMVVALKKDSSTQEEIKLRMLTIMPIVYRGWSSMRFQDLDEWSKQWLPDTLYGGRSGKCSLQASVPIVTAFAELGD